MTDAEAAASRSAADGWARRGLHLLPWMALLAGSASPYVARAQVIDEYVNADIPGYAAQPGVTVESRTHPEYDAQGVRLGSFVFTPVLRESLGYDDNVTGTHVGRGSALVETDARLGAAGGWANTDLGGSLSVDDLEYLQRSNQSFTNWTAAAGASHTFGRDTLSLGFTHLNLNQTSRGLNVPGLSETTPYRVENLRASYRLDLGHIALTPGLNESYYTFDNGRTGSTNYLQDYRDRLVTQPSLEGSYEFATRRRAVVVVRDTKADYNRSPPGLPRQNFNDVSVLGGLAYDADGVIGFRLLAGYEQRNFASSRYRAIQAPIVEASATWTPTGLTTVTGTAARYIEDSAAEATVGFTETALKLRLDHEYLRNVILSAQLNLYLDDYGRSKDGSGGGSQTLFTGGVGASWKLNRTLWLSADYTYATRHSTPGRAAPDAFLTTGEVFGNDYSENTVRLTVRLAL